MLDDLTQGPFFQPRDGSVSEEEDGAREEVVHAQDSRRSPAEVLDRSHREIAGKWNVCLLAGGCTDFWRGDGGSDRRDGPVVNVSWEDAQSYVEWLAAETGEEYGLLSEAEWE